MAEDKYAPAAFAVRLWREGRFELDTLVRRAGAVWWAWDAVNEIAPERLTVPRPKRPRGRHAIDHVLRDAEIGAFMVFMVELLGSERRAAERLAHYHPMIEAEAIRKIYRKQKPVPGAEAIRSTLRNGLRGS